MPNTVLVCGDVRLTCTFTVGTTCNTWVASAETSPSLSVARASSRTSPAVGGVIQASVNCGPTPLPRNVTFTPSDMKYETFVTVPSRSAVIVERLIGHATMRTASGSGDNQVTDGRWPQFRRIGCDVVVVSCSSVAT